VDPTRAAHGAGLDVGDVGSERYHHALGYLIEEGALVGDEHTAFDVGDRHPHGYALSFFTRRAPTLLEGQQRERGVWGSTLGKTRRIVRGLRSPGGKNIRTSEAAPVKSGDRQPEQQTLVVS